MAELEGKTLDRYELRRLIGKGGMANVYEASDKLTGRIVALKIFKREDEEMLRRFIREAQLMASMRENHLVPIYDYGSRELDHLTRYYIVMPYMEGGTLRARIRRGPFSLVEACHALQDVASALDYIHKNGIIHRDIKASNVLISSDGNYFLTDFGIARIVGDETQLTSTGNVLGTVDYVAPELFELDRKADARSDLYSLGVLLYEMVTGRLPFSAENQIALVSMHLQKRPPSPRSIVPSIPAQVERVILKALEKKPEQRYGSARELAAAFCRAVSSSTGASIPDYSTLAVAELASLSSVPRSDQLVLSLPPELFDPVSNAPEVRPPALANGTDGRRYSSQSPFAGTYYQDAGMPFSPVPSPLSPQPAQPATRPFYRRVWFSLVVILLSLLIIAGSIAIIFIPRGQAGINTSATTRSTQTAQTGQTPHATTNAPTATPNLTATAQAALAASATARAQATASAIAAVTATAQAQASATAGVIQTATSGQAVYQDSLNNPTNAATSAANWDQSGQCVFKSDGYHVTSGNGLQGCREANNTYPNAAITVTMRIVSGQSGGVFFRMTTNFLGIYSGYLFEVDSAGRYRILSGTYSLATPTVLQDWTSASALKKGNAPNTLQLIMRGSGLSFFANGAFLAALSDSTYATGQIALLARSDGSTVADVVYTNLNVYPLS